MKSHHYVLIVAGLFVAYVAYRHYVTKTPLFPTLGI